MQGMPMAMPALILSYMLSCILLRPPLGLSLTMPIAWGSSIEWQSGYCTGKPLMERFAGYVHKEIKYFLPALQAIRT
jgi:hypothetical protein